LFIDRLSIAIKDDAINAGVTEVVAPSFRRYCLRRRLGELAEVVPANLLRSSW